MSQLKQSKTSETFDFEESQHRIKKNLNLVVASRLQNVWNSLIFCLWDSWLWTLYKISNMQLFGNKVYLLIYFPEIKCSFELRNARRPIKKYRYLHKKNMKLRLKRVSKIAFWNIMKLQKLYLHLKLFWQRRSLYKELISLSPCLLKRKSKTFIKVQRLVNVL